MRSFIFWRTGILLKRYAVIVRQNCVDVECNGGFNVTVHIVVLHTTYRDFAFAYSDITFKKCIRFIQFLAMMKYMIIMDEFINIVKNGYQKCALARNRNYSLSDAG